MLSPILIGDPDKELAWQFAEVVGVLDCVELFAQRSLEFVVGEERAEGQRVVVEQRRNAQIFLATHEVAKMLYRISAQGVHAFWDLAQVEMAHAQTQAVGPFPLDVTNCGDELVDVKAVGGEAADKGTSADAEVHIEVTNVESAEGIIETLEDSELVVNATDSAAGEVERLFALGPVHKDLRTELP